MTSPHFCAPLSFAVSTSINSPIVAVSNKVRTTRNKRRDRDVFRSRGDRSLSVARGGLKARRRFVTRRNGKEASHLLDSSARAWRNIIKIISPRPMSPGRTLISAHLFLREPSEKNLPIRGRVFRAFFYLERARARRKKTATGSKRDAGWTFEAGSFRACEIKN